MFQDFKKQRRLFPPDHLPSSEADNGKGIKQTCYRDFFFIHYRTSAVLWVPFLAKYKRKRDPVPHLHTALYMHFPQTIVNPLAVGDEYTYRWYIKTAITRTPSKAKNQLEWIVKLAPKNQWAIHVLDHRVSFLSMLEADEGWAHTHILTFSTNIQEMQTHLYKTHRTRARIWIHFKQSFLVSYFIPNVLMCSSVYYMF